MEVLASSTNSVVTWTVNKDNTMTPRYVKRAGVYKHLPAMAINLPTFPSAVRFLKASGAGPSAYPINSHALTIPEMGRHPPQV